jgi:hypothetical protein
MAGDRDEQRVVSPGARRRLGFEILFADSRGRSWVFRRNPAISRPLASMGERTADGTPYLACDVQLLWKAKDHRPKDDLDFDAALPLLTEEQRRWLGASVAATHPGHPWLARLPGRPAHRGGELGRR